MANKDMRFGFRPVKHRNGAPYTGSAEPMYFAAAYGTAVFIGDPVVKVDAGTNAAAFQGYPIGSLPQIERAAVTDGTYCSGVVVGFAINPDNLTQKHKPASQERIAYVATDPDLLFEVQCEGTPTATMMGLNALHINTHAGSTVTGLSGAEIDAGTGTSPSADASNMWRIHSMVNREDNELAANGKLLVSINMHSDLSTGDGDGALGI